MISFCPQVLTMYTVYVYVFSIALASVLIDKIKARVTCLDDVPSVFPGRLRVPGLEAPKKVWWAREVTPGFHVCGRMSERQLKYASEAGFKSIVSLFTYPSEDPPGSFGGDELPVTVTEKKIVEEKLGLQFFNVLEPMDEWASVEAVEKFSAIVPKLKTPSLLRCDRGYTITFVILMYMANQTRYNPEFTPKIYSKEFYAITASMGLNFIDRIPMEVVSEITGEPIPTKEEQSLLKPDFQPGEWLDYWLAHPVYKNWYTAGAITRSHIKPLEEFEYTSVINLRLGLEHNGKPSQEEVNLLNVKSKTGTYGDAKTPPRQSIERLERTLIDPSRPNSYINDTSEVNYECQNDQEFGDSIGYNEELQRAAFQDSSLNYYHLPLTSEMGEFRDIFEKNKDLLLEIGEKGPVLVQCASACRAAYVAVLTAALQYELSMNWALQRLKEMGFGMTATSQPIIYKVYESYLSPQARVEL